MTDTKHEGLPVSGYRPQSDEAVRLVNEFKADEERLLRKLDALREKNLLDRESPAPYDPRWLAIARTNLAQGFMALNRAVFRPQRVKLPEDS